MQAAVAFTDQDDRPDIALFELIGADGVDARVYDLCGGERDLQAENVGGVEQAIVVFDQSEDGRAAVLAGIAADALEHPDAIVQGMGKDMYLGLLPGHQRAIHPDLAVIHKRLLRKNTLQIRTPGQSQPEPDGRLARIEWRTQNS